MNKFFSLFTTILILNTVIISNSNAKDIIRLPQYASLIDNRYEYRENILHLALTASMDKYGTFEIVKTNLRAPRNRLLIELQKGVIINVHNAPTMREWEEKTIPVMFPLMKGLLSYRIFLIHKDNIDTFKEIETIDDLKKLTVGVGSQWSVTKVLREAGGFRIQTGNNYEGLFGMLSRKRFDYFIRGINEVFTEYDERKNKYPKMRIEQNIMMELPLPLFFFVSPKYERIAQRIEYGLQKMKADGSFDKEFYKFYGKFIRSANLHNRKLLRVKNMYLTPHKIYEDPSYWHDITKVTP